MTKQKIQKWWRDKKNGLKDFIHSRCLEVYGINANVPATSSDPERIATPDDVRARVAYLLGSDLAFLCQNPGDKVSCRFLTLHHLTNSQQHAFDKDFIFEIAEYFLFQPKKGNVGMKFPRRFRGRYRSVLIAMICTAVCQFDRIPYDTDAITH
jgi:Domain of unknown function (DUF6532)